ncbi:hypothetical protein PGB90_004057 [Kerria lacca]
MDGLSSNVKYFREAAPPPRGTNRATDPVWLLGPAKCAGSWRKLAIERGNSQGMTKFLGGIAPLCNQSGIGGNL